MEDTPAKRQKLYRSRKKAMDQRPITVHISANSLDRLRCYAAKNKTTYHDVIEDMIQTHLPNVKTILTKRQRRAAITLSIVKMREIGMSYGNIAKQLNADGVQTMTGRGTWSKRTVHRLATNGTD